MTGAPALKTDGGRGSAAKIWSRALEFTAPIPRHRERIFPVVVEELAGRQGSAPAVLSDVESFSFAELAARSNRYSRWALEHGIGKGDVVALLMPNRPEYLAVWHGVTKIGGVAALPNTNLAGASLAHCINAVAPKHIVVDAHLAGRLSAALPHLAPGAAIWIFGGERSGFGGLEAELERHSPETLAAGERREVTIEDLALYIYTSGTTGLPKPARISHGRVMHWSHWFAGMMDIRPTDRMYNCLPMYHSVGGVVATGAVLAGGGSVALREKFSASRFWEDILRWDCTLVQYIGELCRYLVHTPAVAEETRHRIRMACGNGLRPDVWEPFQRRFRIPRIFEFYAATEGGVALFNVEGEPGAIGRVPSYLALRFSPTLIQFDVETGEPVRNAEGFCVRCGANETGEAIGPILDDKSNIGSRFEGYQSKEASEKKILRGVFRPGDAWARTGDLMRKDERGFFHFVDRIGDTFRWKGENVSTTEVSQTLCEFPGIREANVYGVTIPGSDGKAGMAALVSDEVLDLVALQQHLERRLPRYAQPLFLRVTRQMELTETFKQTKTALLRQGFDPGASDDILYFRDPEQDAYVRLDESLYQKIRSGHVRV